MLVPTHVVSNDSGGGSPVTVVDIKVVYQIDEEVLKGDVVTSPSGEFENSFTSTAKGHV